ncbi:hypothetical protein ACJIZ3_005021 [Penstemon smallii]|uniref:TRF2/HOY1 PH-like domain-containing protein n=1 Tax=Penstemon smallii TaxID=265156 RepID=A0ABD3S3W6_9LAMI
MAQLIKNSKSEPPTEKMTAVKIEMEDPLEEENGPLQKRTKHTLGMGGFTVSYNPLDEPSPLGLRLKKSPSLLELIQMKLSLSTTSEGEYHSHGKEKEQKGVAGSGDKLKASNFPASVLKIGTWEYKSRYEGDLVAKCYFAKHKLVWEVLDGGLKNKIEIQWSDIMALKATCPDDGPGTLDVVLSRQPLFLRETNPQPRKHTLWQATSDFTGGQASINRRHYMECPQGLLDKHFEKLTQCDPRLHFLSQQGEITLDSPHFEHRIAVFDDHCNEVDLNREGSPSFFAASPSGAQSSSSKNDHEALSRHSESYTRGTPSPSSATTVEDTNTTGIEQLKAVGNWDEIKVPGLRSSVSMSDLVSHFENRISEQGTSSSPAFSSEEWQSLQILDDINQCLFTDIQHTPDSDEKSLMSRVNSLCSLLQKDNANVQSKGKNEQRPDEVNNVEEKYNIFHDESKSMSRKDSVGDLLLNLPRIASLPQFLLNISEDFENQAR